MRQRPVLTLLTALIIGALALAGCGGSSGSPSDYGSQVESLAATLRSKNTATLNAYDQGKSPADQVASLNDYAKNMSDFADGVHGLTPPQDVAPAQDALVAAARSVATLTSQQAVTLSSPNASVPAGARGDLQFAKQQFAVKCLALQSKVSGSSPGRDLRCPQLLDPRVGG